MTRNDHYLNIGSVAHWLRSNLILYVNDYEEIEIHYSDCLDLIREEFVLFVYQSDNFGNPIQEEFEQYKLAPNIYQSLYNGMISMFQSLVAQTIGMVDPAEYISITWIGPDVGIISQTTNKRYENDRIRDTTVEFTQQDLEQRFL